VNKTAKNFAKSVKLHFGNNEMAMNLIGPQEAHLKLMEQLLDVSLSSRSGEIVIAGTPEQVDLAHQLLNQFYHLLQKGYPLGHDDIERAVHNLGPDQQMLLSETMLNPVTIPAKKKVIYPKTAGQKEYLASILKNDIIFGIGPAGTGKTYLAMAMAVAALMKGDFSRIILTRPAIEAGEKLGFLPGDLVEKVNPYLRPLYDALHDMIDFDKAKKMLERGEIEVAPLAFMRGRTLNEAFVILDEAQNCTREQMKMFLTRLGTNSKTIITGDVTQVDLPNDKKSGLSHAMALLKDIPGIAFHYLSDKDVVRHRLVREIIRAYEAAPQS